METNGSEKEEIAKKARAEVCIDLVSCRPQPCPMASCPYTPPVAEAPQRDYFEAVEPPLQMSFLDLEDEDDTVLLRSYVDLTVSGLYH